MQPIAELEAARVDMRTYEYVYLYEVTPDSVGEEMIDGRSRPSPDLPVH